MCPLDFLKPYSRLQKSEDLTDKTKDIEVMKRLNSLIKLARKFRWQLVVFTGKYEKSGIIIIKETVFLGTYRRAISV